MKASFQFICLGAAAMALGGCSLPNYPQVKAVQQPAVAEPVAQVAKKPTYTAPVTSQSSAAEVEDEIKAKPRWAHQPIGNTGGNEGGGGGDLGGGDEDSGWG